jgi:hypothetical protein
MRQRARAITLHKSGEDSAMTTISLTNKLNVSLVRAQYGKRTLNLPPEEITPNTTLSWEVENAGWVTYDVSPADHERGLVKRFTLDWSLTPAGMVKLRPRDAANKLRIDVMQLLDGGAHCTVAAIRRRTAPPARRRPAGYPFIPFVPRMPLIIPPLLTCLVIAAMAAAAMVASADFRGAHANAPSARASGRTAAEDQNSAPNGTNPVVSAGPALAVSPTQPQPVTCSAARLSYPAILISNSGVQTLTWQATVSGSGATISPSTSSLAGGASQALQLSQPGPVSSAATVSVTSNGGAAGVVFTCAETPVPLHGQLEPAQTTQPMFNYCGDTFGFSAGFGTTLYNIGNGPLTWSQASGTGFSLSPASGKLAAGASTHVAFAGTKANSAIKIHWQDGGKGTVNTVAIKTTCNQAPGPHVNLVVSANRAVSETCNGSAAPAPYTITLDNSRSNVAVNWTWTPPLVNEAPYVWASASPPGGTAPAGQTAQFVLSPIFGPSCPPPGGTYLMHSSVHLGFPQGGTEADIALTDSITGPAPFVNFSINPTSASPADCNTNGFTAPPPVTVTLSNTGNVAATWQVSIRETLFAGQPNAEPWATATTYSGTLGPNAVDQVTITPTTDPSTGVGVCSHYGQITYHADFSVTSGGSGGATLSYAITGSSGILY